MSATENTLPDSQQSVRRPQQFWPSHPPVAHSPEEWIDVFSKFNSRPVVTIGNFDGVHLGHQKILREATARALYGSELHKHKRQGEQYPAVLTFYPHPAKVLRPDTAPPLLMTLEQRLACFREMEIDAVLVLRFDTELAKVSAEDFAKRFLVDTLRPSAVLVGENFRFGHKHAGDVKLLEELGRRWGFEVQIVPPVVENGIVVSSTAVRSAVREGRMEHAGRLLGRPFALAGEIRTGTGQGRKLVVPTLNLATEQECLPKNGVYATESVVGGKTYRSATNVGVRPTFDGHRLAIESHLFDFSENLTRGPMEVRFCKRLRDEQKFSGPEALREQVLRDIAEAKAYFAPLAPPKQSIGAQPRPGSISG
jgi:riboflavin kinase/FMN adenylyltransferase